MRFKTRYEEHNRVHCNHGERMRVEYQLVIDDDGIEVLKPTGMHDLFEEIQSHADSVDLHLILARFMAGDNTALERVQGFYADVSEMPMKLQDMLNINLRGKELFEQLPKEYRDLYGNNYIKFIEEPELLAAKLREVANKSADDFLDVVSGNKTSTVGVESVNSASTDGTE